MSNFEQNIRPISGPAAEDLSGHQYGLVKYGPEGGFVKCGAGEQAVGVNQVKPGKGEVTTVANAGVSFCKAGGPIPYNAEVTSNANGLAVVATEGDKVIGTAATAAGAAGEIFSLVVGVPTGLTATPAGG